MINKNRSLEKLNGGIFYDPENGALFIPIEDSLLEFGHIDEAIEKMEWQLISLIDEVLSFLEDLNERRLSFLLQSIQIDFSSSGDLKYKLSSQKDSFFEVIKEIESVRTKLDNEEDALNLSGIRDALINGFVKAENVAEIKEKSEKGIRMLKDLVSYCQEALKEKSFFSVEQVKEKIIRCRISLHDAPLISPYHEVFRVFRIRIMYCDLEDVSHSDLLSRINDLKRVLNNPPE